MYEMMILYFGVLQGFFKCIITVTSIEKLGMIVIHLSKRF